jgi:BASS family bile acid:Na+ symporter
MISVDLDLAQAALVRMAVVVLMVSLGLRVPPARALQALREPRPVVTTLAIALVFVPAIAWVTVRLFGIPEPVAIGILLVAAAPGGSMALKLVDLAEGDVALGLGGYYVLAVVAPFSMPLTAALLMGGGTGMPVDAPSVLVTLATLQLIPLLGAGVVRRVTPVRAARLGRVATRLTTILLVALVAVASVANAREIMDGGLPIVLAVAAITIATLAVGLALGGRDRGTSLTVAFLSAQRSASLALLVAILIGEPAATGAVVAYGLALLVLNPAAARLLSLWHRPRSERLLDVTTG